MYVDPNPVSTFGETDGWSLSRRQVMDPCTTKQHRLNTNIDHSSSPIENGNENVVPSFRSFVGRTPRPTENHQTTNSPNQYSPVSFSPTADSPSLPPLKRRTSSVYSRATNWAPDEPEAPWQTTELAQEYSNLILQQPIARSARASNLVTNPSDGLALQPRIYSPLLSSPSSTTSRSSTASPPPFFRDERPSVLLPPRPMGVHVARQHLRTVPLDKSKESPDATGAANGFLSEDLRAQQMMGRARSQEQLRVDSLISPPDIQSPSAMFDNNFRHRLPSEQQDSLFGTLSQNFSADDYPSQLNLEPAENFTVAPLQTRQASRNKAMQALRIGEYEASRGRTRQRGGPRTMTYDHFLPQTQSCMLSAGVDDSDREESSTKAIAKEYHHMLSQHYRQPSDPTPTHAQAGSSEESLFTQHLRMVPQPLFYNKPGSRRGAELSTSMNDRRKFGEARSASGDLAGSFSFPLPSTPESSTRPRRGSFEGRLPISPPKGSQPSRGWTELVDTLMHGVRVEEEATTTRTKSPDLPPRTPLKDYPALMSRMNSARNKQPENGKKAKKSKHKFSHPMPPPAVPLLLAADIIAQRVPSPEITTDFSPPLLPLPIEHYYPSTTTALEDNNAVSPPLLSPSSSKPAPTSAGRYRGWSHIARASVGRACGIIVHNNNSKPRRAPPMPQITHVIGSPRPLDERHMTSEFEDYEDDTDNGTGQRRSRILGDLLEGWKESKKERRREELKKLIRVVPVGGEETPGVGCGSRSSWEGRLEFRGDLSGGQRVSQANSNLNSSSRATTPVSERGSVGMPVGLGLDLGGFI